MPVGLPADELIHRNLYYLYGIERREVRRDNFADLWRAIEESIAADRVLLAWVDARDVSDAAFQYNRHTWCQRSHAHLRVRSSGGYVDDFG